MKIKLKNGREVFLELIRPNAMKQNESLRPIAQRISELFGRAFWHSDDPNQRWPVEGVLQRLARMPLVILAFDEARRAIGYLMFSIVRWREQMVLFADSGGVAGKSAEFSENWQNTGLGSEMLKEALRQLPASILAGRTQNAVVVPLFRKLDLERSPEDPERVQIVPLDTEYSEDDRELLLAIKDQVPELHDQQIDMATGISKRIYREGRLGDYDFSHDDTILQQFEDRMKQLDHSWNRSEGDAVILLVKNVPGIA